MLGRLLGRLLLKIGGKRKKVAEKNIALCLPEKSMEEQQAILVKNFESTGIALFETAIGWWWPNWRFNKLITVKGAEHIKEVQQQNKGVLMLTMHFLNLEVSCRGIGNTIPTVVFYRPNNNELMEYFQFRGRNRANKYMLDKRDVKGLIKALRNKEACIYLPDQDYGRNRSEFIPFFGVEAATTTGTMIFAKQKNTATLMITHTRNDGDNGYTINISPPWDNFPSGDMSHDLLKINKALEDAIRTKPEQYMWLHRRFKTRPNENDPSLYK